MIIRSLLVALVSVVLLQGGLASAIAATQAPAKPTASKASTKSTVAKKKASARKAVGKRAAKRATKKVSVKRSVAAARQPAEEAMLALDKAGFPLLRSSAFLVANQTTGAVILEKRSDAVLPIASITKLMTAMVVLDAGQSLSEQLEINAEDIDTLKGTGSRLALGTRLSREEMLQLALMSSENRAASALGRHYPGGLPAFVEAMNVKARLVGLTDTHFADSTGLNPRNVSSPRDLMRLVSASASYPLIREFSTASERHVKIRGRLHRFGNTNSLVRDAGWEIGVSKTGYIREAGRCLVMQAWIFNEPHIIVLMDSDGRYSRTADAKRIKRWFENAGAQRIAVLGEQKDI